jgi:uncharacterized membrane protein
LKALARSSPGSSGNTIGGYVATAAEVGIVILSVVQVAAGTVATVALWEIVALLYLAIGFGLTWRTTTSSRRRPTRSGALDTLSWALPLAASVAGINAAVLVLKQSSEAGFRIVLLVGAMGILTSWLLLNTGFAQVYESVHRRAQQPVFAFAGTVDPTFADFLYLSFTIGTSLSTSDTPVQTSRARLVVMIHSVAGFVYNALVVAIAFQVLQRLVRTT